MNALKKIRLNLNSNAKGYRLWIRGYNVKPYIFNDNQASLCFLTCERNLRLIAAPLSENFSSVLYFTLNLDTSDCFDLFLRFSQRARAREGFYTFYLADENYGLPVSGALNFTSV